MKICSFLIVIQGSSFSHTYKAKFLWNCRSKLLTILEITSIAKNRDLYESNSEIHNITTRFSSDLHTPTANLTTFQKGPFYFGIKVFNHHPTSNKNTSHDINQSRSV